MAAFTHETTIAQIAREHPVSTRVFSRHKIDFCCGGGISLAEACLKRKLVADELLKEIDAEIAKDREGDLDIWSEAPLPQLAVHILEHYHRPLDEELPRLAFLAKKVARVHGERDERLPQIAAVYSHLYDDLERHFYKEEQCLFPWIIAQDYAKAVGPIQVMLQEHDEAGELLRRLRALTADYEIPEGACGSWRALWAGLEGLERSLHEHIHLENNILFPRVVELAERD